MLISFKDLALFLYLDIQWDARFMPEFLTKVTRFMGDFLRIVTHSMGDFCHKVTHFY